MLSFLKAWMLSFSSVEDVILFHGVNVITFEGLLSFFMVYHICYHFWSTRCYLFRVWYYFLGSYHLCYHLVLAFILCYHFMLSFLTVCKFYHFCIIIFLCTGWVLSFMLSFNVIIFCYHFPPFSFSWKRDTLEETAHFSTSKSKII